MDSPRLRWKPRQCCSCWEKFDRGLSTVFSKLVWGLGMIFQAMAFLCRKTLPCDQEVAPKPDVLRQNALDYDEIKLDVLDFIMQQKHGLDLTFFTQVFRNRECERLYHTYYKCVNAVAVRKEKF